MEGQISTGQRAGSTTVESMSSAIPPAIFPIISAVAGASAVAMAETISQIFTIIAFGLLIFTILRLGYIDYVLASVNNRKEKHAKSN